MSKWADLKANPFKATVSEEGKNGFETAEAGDEITMVGKEEARYVDNYVVETSDGRTIPVLVDDGTRSVYPIRAK